MSGIITAPYASRKRRRRTLLLCYFNAPNGTSLPSYTPEYGTLPVNLGAFDIQSNALHNSTSGESIAMPDLGYSDIRATAVIRYADQPTASGWSIIMRGTDLNNFWQLFVRRSSGVNAIELYIRQSGTTTLATSVPFTATVNTNFTVDVSCIGNTFTATANGSTTLTHQSSILQSATRAGVRVFSQTNNHAYMDSLIITTP